MKTIRPILLLVISAAGFSVSTTQAATQYHRLIWDVDPARQAVIGFSPLGTSTSPYVQYGFSTDEGSWQTQQPDSILTFQLFLRSYFVRLRDLPPDSPVYYRVCDQDGCGQHFWFKTAPIDKSPFVMIAGGDTRSGWTNRRKGNELVAKIRPLFIMHGGDYTMLNTSIDMSTYLADWQLTFSDDIINGIEYKRIYPKVPTHGNHEDNNYFTLCQVFGVDYNQDGKCTQEDTYGAFNVSPLLRVYTLNSQFTHGGAASRAQAMNAWLQDDLAQQGRTATWRFAQYHRPMFPHYSGKSDNPQLFDWWAQVFYNHSVNLVVESDTHINKLTWPVRPVGQTFEPTHSGGTLYVGEGSWGAPSRSANNPRPWTIDLASIQQFKVIQVTEQEVAVRTAQFDEAAETLSRQERQTDKLKLPQQVNWWHARDFGEALVLTQNSQGRTLLQQSSDQEPNQDSQFVTLIASDDTYIAKGSGDRNFDDRREGLLADGFDLALSEMHTLIRFDLNNLPSCIDTKQVRLVLVVTDNSVGQYHIYRAQQAWQEATATWNNVGGAALQGELLASFTPSKNGPLEIDLTDTGTIDTWLTQGNHGLVIASGGTPDGVDFESKETGDGPVIKLAYNPAQECGNSDNIEAATIPNDKVEFSTGDGEQVVFSFQRNSESSVSVVHSFKISLQSELNSAFNPAAMAVYVDQNQNGKPEASELIESTISVQEADILFQFNNPIPLTATSTRLLITYKF